MVYIIVIKITLGLDDDDDYYYHYFVVAVFPVLIWSETKWFASLVFHVGLFSVPEKNLCPKLMKFLVNHVL